MEHYCQEHDIKFFKRGGMKGYAHPIEGTDPTKWCNEPDGEEAETIPKATVVNEKPTITKNRAFALSYAKDLAVVGKIEVDHIRAWAEKFDKYLNGEE